MPGTSRLRRRVPGDGRLVFQAIHGGLPESPPAIILGAAYMLCSYRRVIFGQLTRPDLPTYSTSTRAEILAFVPPDPVVMGGDLSELVSLDVMAAPSVRGLGSASHKAAPAGTTRMWHRLGLPAARASDTTPEVPMSRYLLALRRSSSPSRHGSA